MYNNIWISNNTSISGDISSWNLSTGMTYMFEETPEETPEEERKRKKNEIKSIIDDDKYLLQELLTELRNEKIDQLLNNDAT